jgi:LPPG:FO 2-phospho-L-lactate transferase
VISIGPILALPGMKEALRAARAPVVAVSPFVAGHAVKGPTEPFMEHAGLPLGPAGVLAAATETLEFAAGLAGEKGGAGGAGL